MNRIKQLLQDDKKILSIYFTAGFPELNDTVSILEKLQEAGADLVEIGLPFSDPLADGPTIQQSSTRALKNGMNTRVLFTQLKDIRKRVHIPLVIMGYFNPILQFGFEAFCRECHNIGIDGLILPDLPLREYRREYEAVCRKFDLLNIFLITPQTSPERIREIDASSDGFIYMVSSASTTGARKGFGPTETAYFQRISEMKLQNPAIVGFGISNADTFRQATAHARGAIIGSAFINHLEAEGPEGIPAFIRGIR